LVTHTRRDVVPPANPVLIVALEGWIDPGYAAATALQALLDQFDTRTFALFDSDELIDQRARRPRVRIHDGVRGRILWPAPRLRTGTDLAGKGVMFLTGPEPDYRWRPFAREVTDILVELGTELVIGLGAFPAATPHTRPVRLSSTSSDPSLSHQVGYRPGSIEVPARVIDVIGSACSEVGIPSIGLLARVPHYVGAMPFPSASVALLEGLARVAGLTLDTEPLARAAEGGLRQVDELIAQSEEHVEMVRQLEAQYGENDGIPIVSDADIPSGDEIAAELERYLRGEAG
jgi:hypothetical protein